MDLFALADLRARRRESGQSYLEFLRVPSLRTGLYALPAGGVDPQRPHAEDEIYYVVDGRAVVAVAGEERPVAPGDVVYVAAGVDHRFHSIAEDLTLLVFFSAAPTAAPAP
jgi:mannose-6-phosphate isomerase-like protein (cupin superfamily)